MEIVDNPTKEELEQLDNTVIEPEDLPLFWTLEVEKEYNELYDYLKNIKNWNNIEDRKKCAKFNFMSRQPKYDARYFVIDALGNTKPLNKNPWFNVSEKYRR